MLKAFGEATGLHTNISKSELYGINCLINGTDLAASFQGKPCRFPCKYLGLPLHIGRLKREAEQVLVDKVGAKLQGWKGRLMTKSGRLILVRSVFSSIPTYHVTAFPLSKWAIKKINRIRRNFLWKGADETRSGNCLVNWRRVRQPKSLGGLGIKDLACFNRALRLRWMWYRWAAPDKPWTELTIKMSKSEEELFKTCTIITLGNGKRSRFWKDNWLNGKAPIDIAPACFRLPRRKNHSVACALQGRRWMRGLRRMNTEEQLRQFVDLWSQLQGVQLQESEDTLMEIRIFRKIFSKISIRCSVCRDFSGS